MQRNTCMGCTERRIEPNCHMVREKYLAAKEAARLEKISRRDVEAAYYEREKAVRFKGVHLKGRRIK